MVYPQLVVYLTAKAYWDDKEQDEAEQRGAARTPNV